MAQKTALPVAKLEATEQHVEAFKALAHLTRLQVFFFLVRAGREVPAGEISGGGGGAEPDTVAPPRHPSAGRLGPEPSGRALHLLLRPAGHCDRPGPATHRLLLRRIL